MLAHSRCSRFYVSRWKMTITRSLIAASTFTTIDCNLRIISVTQPSSLIIMSDDNAALRDTIASMLPESAQAGASASSSSNGSLDDELTPFPSPVLSAKSLAGLSREWATVSTPRDLATGLIPPDRHIPHIIHPDRIADPSLKRRRAGRGGRPRQGSDEGRRG